MLTTPLYPYQEKPVDFFLARGSLLLAMEQGVGKTMVAVAAAEELLGCGDIGLNLVVVPASLKYQWAERIAEHTDIPTVEVTIKGESFTIPAPPYGVVIDGKPFQKKGIRYSAEDDRARQYATITDETDYVILAYDNILDDVAQIKRIKRRSPLMVTLDEVSAIKGLESRRSKRVKRMLTADYRMGLTGTPIENRPDEAFSIMQWVDKTVLGDWPFFEKSFIKRNSNGSVRRYNNLPLFHEIMSQAMYRKKRSDPDVAPYMPDEEYDTWEVTLDHETKVAYYTIGRDLLAELRAMRHSGDFNLANYYAGRGGNDEGTQAGKAMAKYTAMEQLLDHPDLVVASAMDYQDSKDRRAEGEEKASWPGSQYCYKIWQENLVDELFHSPKLIELKARLATLFEANPDAKVLIYTRWIEMLGILEWDLPYPSVLYHGGLNASSKAAVISRFTNDSSIRLFLSSHAGAYGCDMSMSSDLINYDSDWSAGKGDQINGRIIRASSEFDKVFIHTMECQGTVEVRKRQVVEHKRRIASAVVDGVGADRMGRIENDLKTLTAWLDETIPPA
jgi:SNF2 family DNA or RNA helicase